MTGVGGSGGGHTGTSWWLVREPLRGSAGGWRLSNEHAEKGAGIPLLGSKASPSPQFRAGSLLTAVAMEGALFALGPGVGGSYK